MQWLVEFCWSESRRGHKVDKRTEAPPLHRQAGKVGVFSLEKRRLCGDLKPPFRI
ncbi:hypothetical protein Nmel_002013 [Mimus melanotis]